MKKNNLGSKFSDIKNITKLSLSELPLQIKQKIRDKAVDQAEKNLIAYGRSIEEMTLEDYEHFVKEEETKIWRNIRGKSFNAALLVFFGVSL